MKPTSFLVALVGSVFLAFSSTAVFADAMQAPSNEELYRMILDLQEQQDKLRNEAAAAKAEANAAKAELAQTKQELAALKSQPAPSGVSVAHDPGFFARLENTFMTFGQEGGVADGFGNDADFDSDYTPRVEVGYVGSQGTGIRGRFWTYHDDANSGVDSGNVDVDTHYWDIELFQRWQLTANTELEGAIGLRRLDYEQEFTQDFGPVQVNTLDFDGWGATTALQLKHKVGPGRVYGRGRYSVLVGDADLETSIDGATAFTDDADDSNVHQVELAMGYEIAKEFVWGSVNANLGYEWQYWTNLGLADTGFGGVGNDDVLEDISFHGWVLGIGAEF